MYPTISHLIYDLFGINIPLPIQTFGFFCCSSFFGCSIYSKLRIKAKESQGFLFSVKVKEIIGKSLNTFDVLNSLILGFVVDLKVLKQYLIIVI